MVTYCQFIVEGRNLLKNWKIFSISLIKLRRKADLNNFTLNNFNDLGVCFKADVRLERLYIITKLWRCHMYNEMSMQLIS